MRRNVVSVAVAAAAMILAIGTSARAQDAWSWPEKPVNLQVLPKEMSGARLRAPMQGFAKALGVGCAHCHVGKEGAPLSAFDFASDANPNKDRAREMLRMLRAINGHLQKIEPSGDKRVNMWCHTCHNGRPRPMTLAEELGEAYRAKGVDSALSLYAERRKQGAYDYGKSALNDLGNLALTNGEIAGAVRVLQLNVEQNPDSWNAWDSLAEAHLKSGDRALAEKYYRKSLELSPENQNARDMLKKIRVNQEPVRR